MRLAGVVVVSVALLGSGCASLTSPARMSRLQPGHSYWFDYDASRRGMVLAITNDKAGNAVVRTCAEPAPDVAMQIAANASLEANTPGATSASAGGTAAQAARILSERTQMVMFFREALFRVCEISLNQDLSSEHVVTLYQHIIDTALKLGSDKAFEVDMVRAVAELEQHKAERELAAERVKELQQALAAAEGARAEQAKLRSQLEQALVQEQQAVEGLARTVATLRGLTPATEPAAGEAAASKQ